MTVINSNVAETLNISENGTYDVSNYTGAVVNTPAAPALYRGFYKDSGYYLQPDYQVTNILNLSGVKRVTEGALFSAYATLTGEQTPTGITGTVDMSSITQIDTFGCCMMFYSPNVTLAPIFTSCNLSSLDNIRNGGCFRMFFDNKNLTSVNLSSLREVYSRGAYEMFESCKGLTSVDLSSLTTTGRTVGSSFFTEDGCSCKRMFYYCTSLTTVDLSGLNSIQGSNDCDSMFKGCTSLTTVDLSSLETINKSRACFAMFDGCTSLTTVDLSSLKTIIYTSVQNMFNGCTNLVNLTVNEKLVQRNPIVWLNSDGNNVIPAFIYEPTEYITQSNSQKLCKGAMFSSANMKKLEMINITVSEMFANNTYLETAYFPVLTRFNTVSGGAALFSGCTNANFTSISFPMLQVFKNAVPFTATSFPSQLTVHFRKDQQTDIMATTGSDSNFGANALVFDLIGTITVNGTDYIRQGKQNLTGYYAWQKSGSKITVDGVDYTFDIQEITRNTYGTGDTTKGPILYGWKNGSTIYFTESLNPQVGDFIYTAYNQAQSTTLSISAVDTEFVYTADSAEPDVGDTVYSDAGTTSVGTISAVA